MVFNDRLFDESGYGVSVIVCADDFALSAEVNAGILALAQAQRINAISCLVNFSLFCTSSADLVALKNKCYLGLHLNMTEGAPLSVAWQETYGTCFKGLRSLLMMSYLRRLDFNVVVAEIEAQLALFIETLQMAPDFIDGHQHVQQFPIIRDALLSVYARHNLGSHHEDCKLTPLCTDKNGIDRRFEQPKICIGTTSREQVAGGSGKNGCRDHKNTWPWKGTMVRNTSNGWRDALAITGFPKPQLLALLGGIGFKRRLIAQGIATNASFSGVYRFKNAPHYRDYFKHFVAKSEKDGLIMCHPGVLSHNVGDVLYASRHYELAYLMSNEFLLDMVGGV